MGLEELLITTCRDTQQSSACLWDYSTDNPKVVRCYKNGGIVAPKTLTFLDFDYILTADEDKPTTHLWKLNSPEPDKKLSNILSGKIQAMAVCPRHSYLAAGIGARLYVWQLASGKLFSIQKKNFEPISCIKFSSDGSFVAVAGHDGVLLVYKLVNLVSLHNNLSSQDEGQVEPFYIKHDHGSAITDMHVGSFGHNSRLVTVSSDKTCNLYCLSSGKLLRSLVFWEALSAVIFDGPCWTLYVGQVSGKIQKFSFKEAQGGSQQQHVNDDNFFRGEGHEKCVTCLDLGIWNDVLVSGSEDKSVIIWDISTREILKKIEHKAAITNIKCVLKSGNFFTQNLKLKHVVKNLDRELIQSECFVVGQIQDHTIGSSSDDEDDERRQGSRRTERENTRLRATNQQMYEVAMKILQKYNL